MGQFTGNKARHVRPAFIRRLLSLSPANRRMIVIGFFMSAIGLAAANTHVSTATSAPSVQSVRSQQLPSGREPETELRSAGTVNTNNDQSAAPETEASNDDSSDVSTNVTVNGHDIPTKQNGTTHTTVTGNGSHTSVTVTQQSSGSDSNNTSTNISIQSNSSNSESGSNSSGGRTGNHRR